MKQKGAWPSPETQLEGQGYYNDPEPAHYQAEVITCLQHKYEGWNVSSYNPKAGLSHLGRGEESGARGSWQTLPIDEVIEAESVYIWYRKIQDAEKEHF